MVWGCFGGNSVGNLVKIEGIMDKKVYHSILVKHAMSSETRILRRGFIFQQDNDPKHTSLLCKKYLGKKKNSGAIKNMEWPPQPPDLSPIELLWEELDKAVRKKHPTKREGLWKILQDSWKKISAETLEKLIARMPRICAAVMRAKGRHFDEKLL